MPLSDTPLSVLVTLFLAIFVMIGIYPFIQKSMSRLNKMLDEATKTKDKLVSHLEIDHKEIFADYPSSQSLNDFEIIVLRRIAQARGKALSRRQVNEPLLFGDKVLNKTLWSLHRRGLVSLRISKLLGAKFTLSDSGYRYAREQGYIIEIKERNELI